MSKWISTPFETLEGAHTVALNLGLNPSAIIDTGQGLLSFQTKVGRQRSIIAQKTEGGPVLEKRLPKGKSSPVPLQDPSAPSFGEDDLLLAGSWSDSDHTTFGDIRAHYQQLGPSSKHKFAFVGNLLVVSYPDGDVYEYRQRGDAGVQQRLLTRAGHRTWRYEEPSPIGAEVAFKVGPWERSIHKNLETVEIHWRHKFVNFDNVEVFDVKLYRIGQDEYEYVEDKNTGEVWTRLLSRIKEQNDK